MSIGILAYGSLIDDPGFEIKGLISKKLNGILTPFKIEFARCSSSRGGAPTLVPVQNGVSSKRRYFHSAGRSKFEQS